MGIKTWALLTILLLAMGVTGAAAAPAAPGDVVPVAARALSWVLLASVLGMAFAAAGAAIAQGITASAALKGIARQPDASGKLFVPMILAIVFIETLAIYTLVVALLLVFANPLTALIG